MPRRRVSTNVLKARGSHLRHPERMRSRSTEPPYSGPLGDPPQTLHPAYRSLWFELAVLVPEGVAEHSDRWTFEVLVCLMAKFRRREAKSGEVSQLLNLLAKFGMTPSDRSRVQVPGSGSSNPQPPKDKWADFGLPARPQ